MDISVQLEIIALEVATNLQSVQLALMLNTKELLHSRVVYLAR